MTDQDAKRARSGQTSVDTRAGQGPQATDIDEIDGNARDREMGRDAPPLGDLGAGRRTWTPPSGEQGLSNRPDDGATTKAVPADRRRTEGDGQGDNKHTSGKQGGHGHGR